MSKASHYPILDIHVEACGTSEMGYFKRLGTLRSRTRRLLGRGDRAKAWNEDGVVSAENLS